MLLALTCTLTASAQEGIAPPPHGDLRIVGRADGTVYVYHQQRVRQGYGFHVYRTLGGSEQRLTEQPIRGAMNTPEFGAMVGDELPDVLEALEADDAQRAWLTLRADPIDGTLFSYTYPGVAQALGRLFVDSTAAAGPVGYRIELLDRADEPTGVVLSGQANVTMTRPATPSNLTGESTKAGIALDWTYPEPGPGLADHVPRFHVYERTADGPVRVDERGVLRLDTQDEQGIQLRTDERGATRTFYVVAVDVTGQMSAPTPDLTFVVRDVEPPGFVEGVEARVDRRQAVEVTWPVSPEPDVAGYNVWRAQRTTDPFEKVNGQLLGPFETVYVDSSHTMGGVYYYQVSAVDESGNEGKRSSSVLADVRDLDPPPAPTDLRAIYDPDAEAMTLTWTAAPPAADFKSYVVLRRNTKREGALSRVSIDTLLTTRYVDGGAAGVGFDEGAFYEFGVISEDLGRNVSDTALVRIRIPDTMPPSAPDLSGEVAYGRGVRLLWNAPPEPDALDLLLYRTQADGAAPLDTSAAEGAVYQSFAISETGWTDSQVAIGTRYAYRIAARDSLGNVSDKSRALIVTMRDNSAPRAVRNVRAQDAGSGIAVSWGLVPDDDLSGYRIFRSTSATGRFEQIAQVAAGSLRTVDPEGAVGLWYIVRAIDTSGNQSQASRPTQAVE